MEITFTTFNRIPAVLGIVMRGCLLDTPENQAGFINGITDHLIEQKVLPEGTKPEDAWNDIMSTTTPRRPGKEEDGGRTDLIMTCKEGAQFDLGRFAIVRLQMPDTSWIMDWLNTDARHYETPNF
jgi:hypothetical protein